MIIDHITKFESDLLTPKSKRYFNDPFLNLRPFCHCVVFVITVFEITSRSHDGLKKKFI